EDVPPAGAVRPHCPPAPPKRPAVSAELPARQLARLSLLGHRARSVAATAAVRRLAQAKQKRLSGFSGFQIPKLVTNFATLGVAPSRHTRVLCRSFNSIKGAR